MKSILFITPHLSTGGCPQYLLKKIELLKESYQIWVVEYSYTSNSFVVQRNKIIEICQDTFYSLGEEKSQILEIIKSISPDIIHFEEIPEYFMDSQIADEIYYESRPYKIFETSHDSSVNINNKRYLPDGFLLVSQYQINQFKSLGIPCKLIEYPIEYKDDRNRDEACQKLGLDPNIKHVINVGLFTSRKNQAEVVKYAKKLKGQPIQFHFIGNQADNFRYYWEPIMNDFPKNCIWWGERSDVDTFYQAADLFLFTSRGHENDKETMPLVIREAISWKLPMLIYDLSVYLSYFDKFDNIDYLNFEDISENEKLILEKLGIDKNEEKILFLVSTYPNSESSIDLTKQCISAIKMNGFETLVTSHIPVPSEIFEMCDHLIYDNNNLLTYHDFYSRYWGSSNEYVVEINLRSNGNHSYHGPAVYLNYYNGIRHAKSIGYDKVICVNFDMILDEYAINKMLGWFSNSNGFFRRTDANEGETYTTAIMGISSEFFIDNFPIIRRASDYSDWQLRVGSESNGLENIFFHNLKGKTDGLTIVDDHDYEDLLKTSANNLCSCAEYFTVLPLDTDSSKFILWYSTSNTIDTRKMHALVALSSNSIEIPIDLNESKIHYFELAKSNDIQSITLYENDKEYRKIDLAENRLDDVLLNSGRFAWNSKRAPKIRAIHLVTEPEHNPKEQRSVRSITDFCKKFNNVEYYQMVNEIYKDLPPTVSCNRPNDVAMEPGHMKLSPGHYGCFLAHKNGIELADNWKYDFILIFEGDAIIESDHYELYDNLVRWSALIRTSDIDILGFGNSTLGQSCEELDDIFLTRSLFIGTHSYLFNNDKLSKLVDKINTCKWDTIDLWMTDSAQLCCGIANKVYVKQASGYSLLDKKEKNKSNSPFEIYTE